MDCAVIYSEAALADLQQITAFIAKNNAEVAKRFGNRLAQPDQLSTIVYQLSALRSLNHFFKPRAEHIHASIVVKIATKRDVEPVALLAFDIEFGGLSNVGRVRRISASLGDDIYKEVPSPGLSHLYQRARSSPLFPRY
jgi:hypothetical protein